MFVLSDSLRPALLDKDLRVEWRSDHRLPLERSYIEEPIFQGDIGYVMEGHGSIHQIRNRTLRVVRPAPDGQARQNVQILITPKP